MKASQLPPIIIGIAIATAAIALAHRPTRDPNGPVRVRAKLTASEVGPTMVSATSDQTMSQFEIVEAAVMPIASNAEMMLNPRPEDSNPTIAENAEESADPRLVEARDREERELHDLQHAVELSSLQPESKTQN